MYWRKVHREYIPVCHLRKQTLKVPHHSGFCQTDEVHAASVIVDGICNVSVFVWSEESAKLLSFFSLAHSLSTLDCIH